MDRALQDDAGWLRGAGCAVLCYCSGMGENTDRTTYFLRVSSRKTWSEIADMMGYKSARGRLKSARKYAQEENLPWPVESVSKGASMYSMRRVGYTWIYIAGRFGSTADRVRSYTYKHARRNGLEWPPNG